MSLSINRLKPANRSAISAAKGKAGGQAVGRCASSHWWSTPLRRCVQLGGCLQRSAQPRQWHQRWRHQGCCIGRQAPGAAHRRHRSGDGTVRRTGALTSAFASSLAHHHGQLLGVSGVVEVGEVEMKFVGCHCLRRAPDHSFPAIFCCWQRLQIPWISKVWNSGLKPCSKTAPSPRLPLLIGQRGRAWIRPHCTQVR